jgi:hypothetical protein
MLRIAKTKKLEALHKLPTLHIYSHSHLSDALMKEIVENKSRPTVKAKNQQPKIYRYYVHISI